MAQDYNTWLAANVLNEQQYISYRNVSRALKVHANIAKQMLYEFHRKQNTKKPGSVHATYLLTGTKRAVQTNGTHSQQDGEDTVMRSSPPLPSSSMHPPDDEERETIPTRTIMLVKEENLDNAKALFDTITGIHIYSLQASALGDFQVLTECNRKIASEYSTEDPLTAWKQYGVVQNSHVKRRTGKRPPPPAPPAAKPEPVKAKAAATAASKTSAADLQADAKSTSKSATPEPSKSATSKPPALKKQDSSLFKSFAKVAAKPKKAEVKPSSAGAHSGPVGVAEDVDMTGFSDDNDEDDADGGLPDELADVKAPAGKSKKDRKAELDAMMDMEDEPMNDVETPAAEEKEDDEKHVDAKADSQDTEPKETLVVENGRRRGRRRVMKKKTVKDEEGYLVTREEAAWESFSEDEPAPKKAKIQAPTSNKPATKKGGKPGQGNIMSFFSKK